MRQERDKERNSAFSLVKRPLWKRGLELKEREKMVDGTRVRENEGCPRFESFRVGSLGGAVQFIGVV